MLVDTHAHLNFNAYKEDADEVIRRSLDNNVWMINVGSTYETSKRAVEIAERYEKGVYAAIGLHPIHLNAGLVKIKLDKEEIAFNSREEEFDYKKYKELTQSGKVVAIGEIGLDYYYKPKTPHQFREQGQGDAFSTGKAYSAPGVARKPNGEISTGQAKIKFEQFKNRQKEVFLQQLELAQDYNPPTASSHSPKGERAPLNLPVIFHCRVAHDDLITTLQQYNNRTIKGVIHCFTGTQEQAEKYLKMGFYLGFNGLIFKLNFDEIIKEAPLEKILIETDCPYLTPPQVEGRNEPIYVKYVAEEIAKIKNLSFEEIAKITTENAQRLFGI